MSQPPVDLDDIRDGLETKPFLAHLEDLRWTIIRCVVALAVAVVVCAFSAKYILEALYQPYRAAIPGKDPKDLINIGVVDPFAIHMEVSLFGGVILALPFLLYFVGQFLLPALTPREKRFLGPIFAAGAGLFITGVIFCYFLVLETTIRFFMLYSNWLGFTTMWTAKGLIDFEVQMLGGFGLAFEMPLVILVLNIMGILSSAQLASKRRHAALTIFIISCCLVPSPDLFSLMVLTIPMYVLYEACIWISRIFEKRKEASSASTPDDE